jgi:hypothetical protein
MSENSKKNRWLFTLTASGIFAFFLARQPQDVLHRFPPVKPCANENFPYPLVILRLGATLTRPWNTTREKKKAFAQGLNGGTRSRRTPWRCLARNNAKIPEVVKVNNYQKILVVPKQYKELSNNWKRFPIDGTFLGAIFANDTCTAFQGHISATPPLPPPSCISL